MNVMSIYEANVVPSSGTLSLPGLHHHTTKLIIPCLLTMHTAWARLHVDRNLPSAS